MAQISAPLPKVRKDFLSLLDFDAPTLERCLELAAQMKVDRGHTSEKATSSTTNTAIHTNFKFCCLHIMPRFPRSSNQNSSYFDFVLLSSKLSIVRFSGQDCVYCLGFGQVPRH